ncbi:MAG: alpha/beta fold hydrolase [Pseudomonadales bacterium]|nr:alpha/beta fold hydrolase [Pseudomonadales bacterium]
MFIEPHADDKEYSSVTQTGLAVAHVALQGATELTRMVAETHATITRIPWIWQSHEVAQAQQAPIPYQLVTHLFSNLAHFSYQFLNQTSIPATQKGQLFYSILNGVCGDTLKSWNSPLAQSMMLCDDEGCSLQGRSWAEGQSRVVIFIHGLCLSEREWKNPAHTEFVDWLRTQGFAVAWVRYNSGLPIHENGEDLNKLLENALGHDPARQLTLIGHSMGGLIIRSACHQAKTTGSAWLGQLHQSAYLGSPHRGAPLERLGNAFNNSLGLTPYSRPFMRLGNIRSQGIQDLRHGRLLPEDRDDEPVNLLPEIRHLLIGGHLNEGIERHWIGDGLVPVDSALAMNDNRATLSAPDLTRCELQQINHFALLSDVRVYRVLQQWMQEVDQ